mmetsp:Transcript_69059/g.102609  ORF Transcript_69059/g.102609 Transcript_69059/m.102609 type:complete len:374 (-) Transcript_69059:200-1321(-)
MTDDNSNNNNNTKSNLFRLLDITSSPNPLNHNAIIKEVQQNPDSVKEMYSFSYSTSSSSEYHCYSLHQAIIRRANVDVVNALHNSHPQAIHEKLKGLTVLHLAIRCNATPDVLSLIFRKWPEATKEKDAEGCMPLHLACRFNKQLEVVSMLFDGYPDASRKEDKSGMTPLHYVCIERNVPIEMVSLLLRSWPKDKYSRYTPLHFACLNNTRAEVISLLLEHWPDALKLYDRVGWGSTPLHYACKTNAPLKVILVLLEKWPEGVRDADSELNTPLDYCRKAKGSAENEKVLSYVSRLRFHAVKDNELKVFGIFFAEINWWHGLSWVFDRYPSIVQDMDIGTAVLPHLLSLVGKCCNITTMWEMIINKQDIMAGI